MINKVLMNDYLNSHYSQQILSMCGCLSSQPEVAPCPKAVKGTSSLALIIDGKSALVNNESHPFGTDEQICLANASISPTSKSYGCGLSSSQAHGKISNFNQEKHVDEILFKENNRFQGKQRLQIENLSNKKAKNAPDIIGQNNKSKWIRYRVEEAEYQLKQQTQKYERLKRQEDNIRGVQLVTLNQVSDHKSQEIINMGSQNRHLLSEDKQLSTKIENLKKFLKSTTDKIKVLTQLMQWDSEAKYARYFTIDGKTAVRTAKLDGYRSQVTTQIPLPKYKVKVKFQLHFSQKTAIVMGIMAAYLRDQIHPSDKRDTISFATSPQQNEGWVFSNGTKSNTQKDLFVGEGECLEMQVDLGPARHVIFTNSSNKISKKVTVPASFVDKKPYIFATMDNRGDSVTLIGA